MSYASFDKYDGPILLDVLTNVVMEGGDTDSTGSIVASMWALKHPDGELPADIDLLESPERLQKASRFLCGLLK